MLIFAKKLLHALSCWNMQQTFFKSSGLFFRTLSGRVFQKVQIICRINYLTFKNSVDVDNSSDIKENDSRCFEFDFLILGFCFILFFIYLVGPESSNAWCHIEKSMFCHMSLCFLTSQPGYWYFKEYQSKFSLLLPFIPHRELLPPFWISFVSNKLRDNGKRKRGKERTSLL